MSTARLAYDDADSTQDMARDASACRVSGVVDAARRTVEATPSLLLQAPRQLTRTALSVTDSAARFATRLFD